METNKIVGALCASLLVYLGLNFFGELIYEPAHHGEHLAYSLEVEEAGGGGEEAEGPNLAELFAAADPARGAKLFNKCKACHKLEEGVNATGPSLWGVVGRPIASMPGFKYSGALPAGENWTPEHLMAFLEKPKKFAPGTAMSFAGLKKPQDRADLIAYLNEADGSPEPLE